MIDTAPYQVTTLKHGPFWCSTVYSNAIWGEAVKHSWAKTEVRARYKALAWIRRRNNYAEMYRQATISATKDGSMIE